eukprot:CAMPEP_0169436264 /NCGR_PEP_ID=MMETSP1042-20121227/5498_1 /TAXON_ID=464988 /ORGANISM="Hemiselmis andersenii, Strain CCMP1180" /LENGTH=69 /DNA_ID=CAMNT_0009546951 /DNA_START=1 /DNA_END=210 /DNA_ORIENTATION=+
MGKVHHHRRRTLPLRCGAFCSSTALGQSEASLRAGVWMRAWGAFREARGSLGATHDASCAWPRDPSPES